MIIANPFVMVENCKEELMYYQSVEGLRQVAGGQAVRVSHISKKVCRDLEA